jgi:propanol-preferring alcohol dehydrogenase
MVIINRGDWPMKAMVLNQIWDLSQSDSPLELVEMERPQPGVGEILIRVTACGICHTELDEIEGRTPPPHYPIVPGHQVVGRVAENGSRASRFQAGERVGVAWIHSACGVCHHCRQGDENLCASFRATGRDAHGGYAEYMTVPESFAYPIPDVFSDMEAAPLLCAGAIGYRSLRLTGLQDGQRLGLTGFGASAHIVLKLVRHAYPGAGVFVFSRSQAERDFARELGADWNGDIGEMAPQNLDCIIDTTPAWKPVVEALHNLAPGGRLVINAIRKEENDKAELLRLDYPTHLWLEKEIKSVANVSRADVGEFLELAARIPIKPEYQVYSLDQANLALMELKQRKIRGAKVISLANLL